MVEAFFRLNFYPFSSFHFAKRIDTTHQPKLGYVLFATGFVIDSKINRALMNEGEVFFDGVKSDATVLNDDQT